MKKRLQMVTREPQKYGTEERNKILENFFPKAVIHSTYYLPFSPPKGYTLQANPLPVCSDIHSLDTLSFLQHIVANSIYQTLPPTSFHLGGYQQLLGRQELEKGRGLSPLFHPPTGISARDPVLSGIMANSHAPCSSRVGIFRWLHRLFGMSLSPLSLPTNPAFCRKFSVHNV